MAHPETGQCWIVGVGPGDPELLTLKAVQILRRVSVIYHAGPEVDRGRGWGVVRHLVRPEQEIRLVLTQPLRAVCSADWKAHYLPGVESIVSDCRGGRNVAFITEGDPTIHSTASWVWQ